jgi:transcriptional regulator with XRE-family HTH domain
MSQSDLSTRSGIPKPTLSRYENDHVSPSIATLSRLSEALHVGEGSLLGEQATPEFAFLAALISHGVTFPTVGEAERVAAEVAAILKASQAAV